jgi:spermidine synthase
VAAPPRERGGRGEARVPAAFMKRSRTVFEARSPLSGRIRVIEDDRERRLVVGGETLSIYPRNGDWSRLRREYWWQAFEGLTLPPRPSALFVGLGGGTQLQLLRKLRRPKRLTVIERDALIIDVAREWFDLDAAGPIEVCCGDATDVIPGLTHLGRRFDFVMEDAVYGDDVDGAVDLARALPGLVAPRGTLVLNRHWRRDAARAAEALAPFFREIWSRRVKREGENVLIFCARPLRGPPLRRG